MKMYILLITFIFPFNVIWSQEWIFENGENPFDGKYKTSYVMGKGREFPYNNPYLVVNCFEKNNVVNVYLSGAGYAGCENKLVKIKFDSNDTIYTYSATTDKNEDNWYLQEIYHTNTPVRSLVDRLKTNNKVFIRLSSDCGTNDLEFPLKGSSKAINFVTSNPPD